MSKMPKVRKTFKKAIEETPEVQHCYCEGKSAFPKKDANKVELNDPRKCGGSLFIDQCLFDQGLYPNDNRWDYAIDYNGEVFFFEVHTASSSEVSTVLKKLEWLKDWLINKAPEINALKAKSKTPFYWVQSNGYHILPNSSYERAVLQKGMKPISKLVLK
jgi:hypothetical protein